MSFRVLPVPDGLDGQRVDSALARMLGPQPHQSRGNYALKDG